MGRGHRYRERASKRRRAMNNETLKIMIGLYENKLKELMTKKEFDAFVAHVAKEAFRKEIEGMADCDFKEFCLIYFNKIVGEEV